MSNPSVKELVIKRVAAFLKDMIESREEQLRGPLTALYASALGKGPSEISQALLTREPLRELFKDYVQETVQISDELRIPVDTWREWVFEAIAALPGTAIDKRVNERVLCLKWQEPSLFLAGLIVQFTSDDAKVNRHTRLHQFIKLYHPLSQARENAADALLPYLAVSMEKKTELRSGITREIGYETVAEEIQSISETSWEFFWGRLASFLQAGVPIDVSFDRITTTMNLSRQERLLASSIVSRRRWKTMPPPVKDSFRPNPIHLVNLIKAAQADPPLQRMA